jgi:hypothetical protein
LPTRSLLLSRTLVLGAIEVDFDSAVDYDENIQALDDRLSVPLQHNVVTAKQQCAQAVTAFRIAFHVALKANAEIRRNDGVTGRQISEDFPEQVCA